MHLASSDAKMTHKHMLDVHTVRAALLCYIMTQMIDFFLSFFLSFFFFAV